MSARPGKNKTVAAAELLGRLQHDAKYQAQRYQTEVRRQEYFQRHKLAAAPVIRELKTAGFNVESLDELRRSGTNYEIAIPVLLKWLPLVSETGVKDSIVRALSVPQAKQTAALPLITEYRAAGESKSGLKWAIGNALAVVADDNVFNEIADLIRDKQNGKSREMLAIALANMNNSRAIDILLELLDDDEVVGHVIMGLAKLKAHKARYAIEPFLNHSKPWIRNEAKKALKRLAGEPTR